MANGKILAKGMRWMSGYSTDMEGFYKGIVERWNRRT
jgi:hypothetical protein